MNNFDVIYKILKALEISMDYDEFDIEAISANRLGITENRRNAILEMMAKEGYIDGVHILNSISGKCIRIDNDIRITLKGLEYLANNSMMAKAQKLAKGIKEVIPGM